MQPTDDSVLLRQYAENRSDEAFAALVARHVNLVYSVAMRCVGDSHRAEEVAQAVFILLAKKAARLRHDKALSSWLFQTTRLTANNFLRSETRRHRREQEAHMQSMSNDPATDIWPRIEPLLDEAVAGLDEVDRQAIVLRYYEGRSLRDVGAGIGASEAAAEKRVSRAVEKLRTYFTKRGVSVGASGLIAVVSANAVQAAPVGLTVTISTAIALAETTFAASTAATVTKAIAMTTLQKTLITLALLTFLSGASYKAYLATASRNKSSRNDVRSLETSTQPERSVKKLSRVDSTETRVESQNAPDLARLAGALRAALHNVPGDRNHPSQEVYRVLRAYGSYRREAFATLLEAAKDPDLEVRKGAVAAMGRVGMVSTPRLAQFGIVGDAAPEAKPYLWNVLLESDPELTPFALTSLQGIGFDASEIPALTSLMTPTADHFLLRYLPEAIAKTIQTDPAAAAPFISSVQAMLDNSEPGLQFEAACSLAKYEAEVKPQILDILLTGLKSDNGLQQLMALETLQSIGPIAEPTLQAILDFGDSTTDKVLRDVAFKAIGQIRSDLRSVLPEVEQALKREENIAKWNEKFISGNYTRQDLMDALKEPLYSVTAAEKLGEMGTSAQNTVPNLIAAMAGQDQAKRDRIMEAIHQIDPQASVAKVDSGAISIASKYASFALEEKSKSGLRTPLAELLEESQKGNSEWLTQQEVISLAQAIRSQSPNAYRAFFEQLRKREPGMADLIAKPVDQ